MKVHVASAVCILLLITGCASNPGVVAVGANSYILTRSSSAGAFANMAALRGKVIQEANAFAASKGMVAIPINATENRPAVGFPSFEYQFRLVTAQEATRIEQSGASQGLIITRNHDPEGHAAMTKVLANQQNQPPFEAKDFSLPTTTSPTPNLPTQAQLNQPSHSTGKTQISPDGKLWYEYRRLDGSTFWSNKSPY